ncbi:J domain-containing protein [Histomonas meleagridis]|nr:J domain-containing protein [Histomonas meleagridis]
MSNLYEVLGVSRDATLSEIKKGYRLMAKKYHPDKQTEVNPVTTQKFLEIVDAYSVLSSESLRASYDKELELKEATNSIKEQISQKRKKI